MKHIVFVILFLSSSILLSQAPLTLPCSTINICLDQTVAVSPNTIYPVKNLVVRDFNGDGFDDVMVVDTLQQKIFIYRNTQAGSFAQTTVGVVSSTSKFNSADAGDFDGDGDLDIVVCSRDTLKIYSNSPGLNFSFVYAKGIDPSAIFKNFPTYLKAGKLNNDIYDDIAIIASRTSSVGPAMVVLAIRNSFTTTSTFNLITDYTASIAGSNVFNPIDSVNISIGNYDNSVGPDFTNEIVIADKRINNLMPVFRNNTLGAGTLTFQLINVATAALLPFSATVHVVQVESIDINNDGSNELLALARAFSAGPTFQGVAYFNGATSSLGSYTLPSINGTYQFLPMSASPATASQVPMSFKMGDINGDGFKDIIGMNNQCLIIYLYKPSLAFNDFVPFDSGNPIIVNFAANTISAEEVNVGRFDNNGLIDIFYKSWRNPIGGVTGVIPNYSHSLTTKRNDTLVCAGRTVTMGINITPTIGVNNSIDWYVKPGGFVATGSVLTASTPGSYYPILKIPFPSGTNTCSIQIKRIIDSVKVKAIPNPSIGVSDANPIVCSGDKAEIKAVNLGTTNILSYSWTINGNLVSTTQTLITNPINSLTFYELTAYDFISKCSSSLSIPFNIHPPNNDNISVSDKKICQGDSVKLSFSGAMSYTWSTNSNDSVIYVKPLSATTFSLLIEDYNGCIHNKTVGVLIDNACEITIHNGITPNGDNVNDVWIIENINRYPNNKVSIFNRWGIKIFDTDKYNNQNNAWPSNNESAVWKADKLISSTYFYVLDLGDGSALRKGWIELIK